MIIKPNRDQAKHSLIHVCPFVLLFGLGT